MCIKYICLQKLHARKCISGDEHSVSSKGHHVENIWLNLKKSGNGFQSDAICDDGYALCFYFYNKPAPYTNLKQGSPPLNSHMFPLFDWLDHKGHKVVMDDILNSVKFASAWFLHPLTILVHAVIHKGVRGVPPVVKQEEAKTRNGQTQVIITSE